MEKVSPRKGKRKEKETGTGNGKGKGKGIDISEHPLAGTALGSALGIGSGREQPGNTGARSGNIGHIAAFAAVTSSDGDPFADDTAMFGAAGGGGTGTETGAGLPSAALFATMSAKEKAVALTSAQGTVEDILDDRGGLQGEIRDAVADGRLPGSPGGAAAVLQGAGLETQRGTVIVSDSRGELLEIVHSSGYSGGNGPDEAAMEAARRAPLRGVRMALPAKAIRGAVEAGPFLVSPGLALFEGFAPEGTYSTVLTFRNSDRLGRSLRVIPPASRYFGCDPPEYIGGKGKSKGNGNGSSSVMAEGKEAWHPDSEFKSARPRTVEELDHPGAGGDGPDSRRSTVLAPGMGMSVRVHFTPNGYRTYTDTLTVLTESGKFAVRCVATRPPPLLSLPSAFSAGLCLPMDVTYETFRFRNSGSATVCRLFLAETFPPPAGTDPSVAWKLNLPSTNGNGNGDGEGKGEGGLDGDINPYGPAPGRIACPPFVVEPTHFELAQGDYAEVRVLFAPPAVGRYQRELVILTDAGDVTRHVLRGECSEMRVGLAAIEAVSVHAPVLPTSAPTSSDGVARREAFEGTGRSQLVPVEATEVRRAVRVHRLHAIR